MHMAMTYHNTNQKRLAELQPHVRDAAQKALAEAEKAGLDILVTQGLRTFAEQNELYAQGRTKPGKIVTNAKAGQSYHNFGLAFDFCLIENGKACWDVNNKWKQFVNICKKQGFEWGGDWTSFKDYPHFEMTGGLSLAQCRAKWPNGWKPTSTSTGTATTYVEMDELPLKKGHKDGFLKLVSKLQERLKVKVDGYFGATTEESVKMWQERHDENGNAVSIGKGLTADGVVGEKTWKALFGELPKIEYVEDYHAPFEIGSKGDAVKKIQNRLKINADGYYGVATARAVRTWQERHDADGNAVPVGKGLPATGIVDFTTWYALFPEEKPKEPAYEVVVDGEPVVTSAYDKYVLEAVQNAIKDNKAEKIEIQRIDYK